MRGRIVAGVAGVLTLAVLVLTPEPHRRAVEVAVAVLILLMLALSFYVSWGVEKFLERMSRLEPRDGLIAAAIRQAARTVLAARAGGDELTRLARQLGLSDPWRVLPPSTSYVVWLRSQPERIRRVVGVTDAELVEDRQTGRTTRMLLMALLSIERGVPAVVVGLSELHAQRLREGLQRMILQRRWGVRVFKSSGLLEVHAPHLSGAVELRVVNVYQLVQATIGRLNFDLYIDHAVWEHSACSVQVQLTANGPVVHVVTDPALAFVQSRPRKRDHALDAAAAAYHRPAVPRGMMRVSLDDIVRHDGREMDGKEWVRQSLRAAARLPAPPEPIGVARFCTVNPRRPARAQRQVAATVKWARRNPGKRCVVVVHKGQEREVGALFGDHMADIQRTECPDPRGSLSLHLNNGAVIELSPAGRLADGLPIF